MRSTESTRPTISTSASALSLGTTSRTAVPAVITSSTSSTFMPSASCVPTIMPPSPWSFFSLRSNVYPTCMPWPPVSAMAVDTASGMPLYAGPNTVSMSPGSEPASISAAIFSA